MKNLDRDILILLHEVARIMRTRFDQWARNYGLTRAQGKAKLTIETAPRLKLAAGE